VAQVTKEDIQAAVEPVNVAVGHILKSMDEVKAHLKSLPCNDLTARVGKVEAELAFRVETYEKEAHRREVEIQAAFDVARSKPDKGTVEKLSDKIEKLEDKKEVKLWGGIVIAITFILNLFGWYVRQ